MMTPSADIPGRRPRYTVTATLTESDLNVLDKYRRDLEARASGLGWPESYALQRAAATRAAALAQLVRDLAAATARKARPAKKGARRGRRS